MDKQRNERIGKALGRIPSGCAIVTARQGNAKRALLASWLQQAGFEPPMISVAVKKGRPIEATIDASKRFVLNLLGEDCQDMFSHFGRGFAPTEDPFVGIATSDVDGGVLIQDRIGWISATVHGKYDAGDHWLYVGVIADAEADPTAKPYVHQRKSGMNY